MSAKKILICDDDEGILDMLTLVLEDSGFEVIAESNSLNVYQQIETHQPDLLLIDLWMPVLSGDQVVKQLKQNPDTQFLPVLVISASTDGRKIAEEARADGFIAKPFDLDKLINQVQSTTENDNFFIGKN
ncbi:response regulator [Mucilaginibacter sp.]